MKKIIYLFEFFFLFIGLSIAIVPPIVRVPVYQQKFIQILVGNPGHFETLRIDFASNDTLTLFNLPSSYSTTFVQYQELPNIGSEIIYLGCHMFRVPVKFDNSKRRYDTKVNYHGIIGFGYYSHIWNHWQKMTISSSTLIFGKFDQSLARRNYKPFEIHSIKNSPIHVDINDQEYNLFYSPGDVYTKLPTELYHHVSNTKMKVKPDSGTTIQKKHNSKFVLQLEKNDYTTKLPTGFEFSLLKRQPKDSKDIILGEHATKSLICHYNFIYKSQEIHPSYLLFDNGDTQPLFDSIGGIIITTIITYWLIVIITEKLNNNFHLLVASKIEIYGYFVSLIFVWVENSAFKCQRYIQHFLFIDSNGYSWEFDFLYTFFFINSLFGLISTFVLWSKQHYFSIRRSFLETSLVLSLWLTQVSNHQNLYEHLLLILLSSFYSIVRLISLFDEILLRHFRKLNLKQKIIIYITLGLHASFSILFSIVYNLNPTLNRFWYSFPNKSSSLILMLLIFVGIPFIFLFLSIHISRLRNTILFNKQNSKN